MADNPELAKAVECIDRAGTLTREGLAAAAQEGQRLPSAHPPPRPPSRARAT